MGQLKICEAYIRGDLDFEGDLIEAIGFREPILYQDFFTFDPPQSYDGISMMGVLEHLTDYRQVLRRLSTWVRLGGRVYLDFASSRERFGTSAFITKHAWAGMFRGGNSKCFTPASPTS